VSKKIGIVANLKKKGALELLDELKSWLGKRDVQVWDAEPRSIGDQMKDTSLVICLGGDGTILSVARQMKELSIPILGVNLGSLGFITEVKQEEMYEELNTYLLDRSEIEERFMLSCSVRSKKVKKERRFIALNDIVVNREGLTRLLNVSVQVSGETLYNFAGDGVIIATPTGSTAYSLSAGGSIAHPQMKAILVTPLAPHTPALRPILLKGDERISVRIQPERHDQKALVVADGQENMEIDDTYTVEITSAPHSLKLIKSSKRSFFSTLREKFKLPDRDV